MNDFLDIRTFGDGDRSDLVLLAPHADDGGQFLEAFPAVTQLPVAKNPQDFLHYIALSRDTGVDEVSESIAQQVTQAHPKLGIKIVRPKVPRAIIDMNRVLNAKKPENSAIPAFVLDSALRDEFAKIYDTIATSTRGELEKMLHSQGIFVGVHTMYPYSPANPLHPFDQLKNMINDWVYAGKRGGKKRKFDLLTGTEDGSVVLAEKNLVAEMTSALARHSIPFDLNKPYGLSVEDSDVISDHFYRSYRGIEFDAPKDMLTRHTAREKEVGYFIHPEIAPEMVERVTLPLGEGLSRYFEGRQQDL